MSFIHHWWWTMLFVAICWGVYAKGMQKKKEIFFQLDSKIKHLEVERLAALQKREDLKLQIESQSDPAWIEMLLMKKLGVVPEGQVKVYFERE
jgi:hypothetical protein